METLKRWTINIVQVIVAIFVIGFGMELAWYWVDREDFAETSPLAKYVVRCDSLLEDIKLDSACLDAAPGCTLTRDEHATAKKRVEKFGLFCTSD